MKEESRRLFVVANSYKLEKDRLRKMLEVKEVSNQTVTRSLMKLKKGLIYPRRRKGSLTETNREVLSVPSEPTKNDG